MKFRYLTYSILEKFYHSFPITHFYSNSCTFANLFYVTLLMLERIVIIILFLSLQLIDLFYISLLVLLSFLRPNFDSPRKADGWETSSPLASSSCRRSKVDHERYKETKEDKGVILVTDRFRLKNQKKLTKKKKGKMFFHFNFSQLLFPAILMNMNQFSSLCPTLNSNDDWSLPKRRKIVRGACKSWFFLKK